MSSPNTTTALRFGAVPLRFFFAGVEIEDGVVAPVGGYHRHLAAAQRDVNEGQLLDAEVFSAEIDRSSVRREAPDNG